MAAMFVSPRERRLWLWALAAVAAVFATLGLARTVSAELVDRGLLDAAYVTAFLMVAAAAGVVGLRVRPGGAEIGVALGVTAVYLMVFVRMALPEERTHLIEYGVVAVLAYAALRERRDSGRPVPAPWLLAFGLTAAVGVVDEIVQAVLPSRVFDVRDIGFNLAAAALAIGAAEARRAVRRRA